MNRYRQFVRMSVISNADDHYPYMINQDIILYNNSNQYMSAALIFHLLRLFHNIDLGI